MCELPEHQMEVLLGPRKPSLCLQQGWVKARPDRGKYRRFFSNFLNYFLNRRPASPNIKIRLFVAWDIIQTLSVQHLQVFCNHLPADGSGKSSRVVILSEVLVSPLQCGGMWGAAVKSQVVLISHTPCKAIYHCKALQASTKVYTCGSVSQISQHV